jgi:hypothetical protein
MRNQGENTANCIWGRDGNAFKEEELLFFFLREYKKEVIVVKSGVEEKEYCGRMFLPCTSVDGGSHPLIINHRTDEQREGSSL